MNRAEIISRYVFQIWRVSPRFAAAHKMQLAAILKGNETSFSDLKALREDLKARTQIQIASKSSSIQAAYEIGSLEDVGSANIPVGSTAIVRVDGVIQKNSDACTKGTDEYIAEIEMAGSHPNIDSVLVEINSGGGSAFGPEDFANTVKTFEKQYGKPIAAIIRNEACSAAYEMIAPIPKIYISGNSALAGSIGTMISMYDDTAELEALGIKEIVVRATDSFNKNEEFYQARQGNIEPLQKNILDPLNKSFQEIVRKGRRGKLNLKKVDGVPEPLTGKIYIGQEIIKAGLADEMGSRFDAIKYLKQRAKQMKANSSTRKSINQMFKLKDLSQEALNDKAAEISAKLENTEQSAEQLEQLNKEFQLVQHQLNFKQLEQKVAELEAANKNIESAASEIKELEGVKLEQSEKIAELEALSGQKDKEIQEANAKIEELQANDKTAELQTQLDEVNAAKTELEANNKKYKQFIESKFGASSLKAIGVVPSEDGSQPEAKKVVKPSNLSKKQQHLMQFQKLKAAMNKSNTNK